MSKNGKIIEASKLSKIYGTNEAACIALSDLNLTVEENDYIAICGTSGSGKTTLFNLISGMDADFSGSLHVFGKDLSKLNEKERASLRKRYMGIIYQFFNLVGCLNVEQNLLLSARLQGRKISEKELNHALEILGLQEKRKQNIHALSGGQQQRIAIGRALLSNSRLILADEPTGNLDSKNTEMVLNLFERAHKTGRTILMITHDMDVAKRADKIIDLRDGKVFEHEC